jgi:methionine-rich copper-binding protein CopC
MKIFLSTIAALLFFYTVSAQTTLISYNSTWKYLSNGSNQGTAWRGTSFNDASWATANASFGYGISGITTTVSFGNNNKKKYITTYFRKLINIADASIYSSFTLNLKRDDGAVVYLNGTEVYRSNMPTGTISFSTKASAEATDNGTAIQTITLGSGSLVTGNNVVAVEIHQAANNGPDLFFDLQLNGAADVTAPEVNTYSPADNATNISNSANLVLTFSENIQKGVGNILIKEGGVTTQTIDVTSAAVTVSGNTATINPADFSFGASVNIEMPAGVFKDLANYNYAGIASATTWNFTVISPDLTPPTVNSYSPSDNSTGVSNTANLVLTFSENIQKGAGNILIKEAGFTTQTIDVTSATVTVSGNTATINPSDFTYSAAVNIEITAGAFKDLSNNNYPGITDATTWNFSLEAAPPSGPQTLIAYGSSWKYLDNGSNQGTAWRATGFNDAGWVSGNAQLGYGDGDEATVVGFGGNTSNKYVTTYFRKTFSVSNPSAFTIILGNVKRDDGVAIYINGTEVYRNNLAASASYTTLASLASDDGATPVAFNFSPSVLVSGNNVIAVEIHQNSVTSSDISFDMELIGTDVVSITRGPYMNMALQNSAVIRWRTDAANNSKVNFGTSPGNLSQSVTDITNTTEHIVTLTGLAPNTLYYYSIGSTTQILQGDANNYFKTMPVAGSTEKIRVLAMGDMGDNSANQVAVRNAYLNFNGSNYTNAWLLLGDNAYDNGTETEYQTNFFNIYQGNLTKNHVLWPSPGNHDYANSSARQADHNIPYYSIFSLPTNGEAGGVPSNNEAFYSYNYGNIHFVSLDSYGWEAGNTRLYDTLGPQMTWLKQDLAANTQPWTVIYFHHPPYTKTSHNSDTETELINMRQRVVRIFERFKVDLVLSGHSHGYERSFLINGHYDVESTFNPGTHALSTSSAKYNGTANSCIYIKNSTDLVNGIVYVVAGSAGQLDGTSSGYPHNAMYYSDVSTGGALFFEVEGNRLDAKWVCADNSIRDQFTIMKDVNKTTNLAINSGTPTQISASWTGNYSWNTAESTKTITVAPTVNTTYTVTDGAGCITDVFNITVNGGRNRITNNTQETDPNKSFRVVPTFVHRGEPVLVRTGIASPVEVSMVDINGKLVQRLMVNQATSVRSNNLQPGVYFIKLKTKSNPVVQKIVVLD